MQKLGRGSWIIIALGLVLIAGLTLGGFFARQVGVSVESHSMSHNAANEMAGIIDPGDIVGEAPVGTAADVTPEIPARANGGPRVAGDDGDVISFWLDSSQRDIGIIHRAIVYVQYNATADAYDVPDLGLRGVRSFVVPGLGTFNPANDDYVHTDFWVTLDPDTAGRHDGFLTKGDNNEVTDQDAYATSGVTLKDPRANEVFSRHVQLVQANQIEGKVAHIADKGDAPKLFYYAAGAAFLLTVGAVVVLPRLKRSGLAGTRCSDCGRAISKNDSFCPACGATR